MNERTTTLALTIALIAGCTAAVAQDGGKRGKPTIEASAAAFVKLLVELKFADATGDFDATMTRVMPADKLGATWKSVVGAVGPFEKQVGTRKQKAGKYTAVFVTCKFEKAALDVRVVFDREKKIAGLFFQPAKPQAKYAAPDYVNKESFGESEVTVGTGEWKLPGTLTLPRGAGPFPAVVLVHGSGPNDRDETIGPNKPFRDLAWGLASKGIAVLRYDKRTKVHAGKFQSAGVKLTVKEETVDDALAAVALLRKTERIDPRRIFVLGHSLGGSLIPRIGARDAGIRGFISMAGSTRSIEDLVIEQMNYIFSLDGDVSEAEQQQLEKIHEQVARVKDPRLSVDAANVLGAPGSYWLDLRGYDAAAAARKLKQPMLFLQGERDYQVTMSDFENWKTSLTRDNVQFKSYPRLNHLFIAGEGKSRPDEYQKPGHVAREVIDDVSGWIQRH